MPEKWAEDLYDYAAGAIVTRADATKLYKTGHPSPNYFTVHPSENVGRESGRQRAWEGGIVGPSQRAGMDREGEGGMY